MSPRRSRRRLPARVGDFCIYAALRSVMCFFGALPVAWIDPLSDALGYLVFLLDRRGRRVGMQNLDVIFGDERTLREKRQLLRKSMRAFARSMVVLLNAAPLTPQRFRRWVDVPQEVEDTIREAAERVNGAVVVSAHVGNWELLLGLTQLFKDIMPVMFLVEASFNPGINRFLADVRGTGGGESTSRKGGAGNLLTHIRRGGAAGLVVDRNVRRNKGGIYVPFLGLSALTTPLPAKLALSHGVPIVPMFCLPTEDGRYRIRLGPECALWGLTGDYEVDVREITMRVNRVVEDLIRERPELWNLTIKRFKSRPTEAPGAHPRYSRWER